jgi:DNA-binding SARP family transcriptional activator
MDREPGPYLRIVVLGVFRAELDGVAVALSPISRTVLARLVLARGGRVPADRLYRDAWPEPEPVVSPARQMNVRRHVAHLRRLLGPASAAGGASPLLTDGSERDGYRLVLARDQVDVHHLEDLIQRAAAARDEVAVDLLQHALIGWTGGPLRGLPDRAFVRDWTTKLLNLRDRACRDLAAVAHEVGRWESAAAAFEQLLVSHPGDVRLRQTIDQLRIMGRQPGTPSTGKSR